MGKTKKLQIRYVQKPEEVVIEARMKVRLILFGIKLWFIYRWEEGGFEEVFKTLDEAKAFVKKTDLHLHSKIEKEGDSIRYYLNEEEKLTEEDFEKLRQIVKKIN